MNPDQIRTEKHQTEEEISAYIAEAIEKFQNKTGISVQDIAVSVDTFGTPGRDLQRHYQPPKVAITLESL